MILFCIIHNALKRKICIDLINRKKTRLPRGHALKRSPEINRKSKVSYPGPGFLSSATWPSLPKKHYNGLNQLNQNRLSKPLKYTFIGLVKLSNIFSL